METQETIEMSPKIVRGKQLQTISFVARLHPSHMGIMNSLMLKKMKQTGEDVTRDVIIAEALECLAKGQHSAE